MEKLNNSMKTILSNYKGANIEKQLVVDYIYKNIKQENSYSAEKIDETEWYKDKDNKRRLEEYIKANEKISFDIFDVMEMSEEELKPDFVVKGIERGNIGFLSGAGGAGKGFWLNHLMLSTMGLTAKTDKFGNLSVGKNNFLLEGVETPRIGYFSFEDDKKQWSRRMKNILKTNTYEKPTGFEDNTFKFIDMTKNGAMFKENEYFKDNFSVKVMGKEIKENKFDLIIIDTLSVINQRCDENSNHLMAELIEDLKSFAREMNVGVLLVHHQNKSGLNANNDTNEGSLRGASSLIGNARFVLSLEKCKIEKKEDGKVKKVFCNNWVEVRIDKANFTKLEKRVYYRHPNGALSEMPEGFEVVDDKRIGEGTKNQVPKAGTTF